MWFYTLYLILGELSRVLYNIYDRYTAVYQIDYLLGAAAAAATFILAYCFSRIRLLSDKGIKILSIVLYLIGILSLFFLNSVLTPVSYPYFEAETPSLEVTLIGTGILIIIGMLSVLALRDLMKIIVLNKTLGIEWYPLIISGYFVIVLTQNLITQFNLSFSNAVISIIYVLTALAWIVYGFMRRFSFIRKSGLGLSILSVIKLFLLDLYNLAQGFQIISYFALGITLIAISFVYQYFNKRLELKMGDDS